MCYPINPTGILFNEPTPEPNPISTIHNCNSTSKEQPIGSISGKRLLGVLCVEDAVIK